MKTFWFIIVCIIHLIAQAIDLIINNFGIALNAFFTIAALILFWPLGLALLAIDIYYLWDTYHAC